MVGLFGRINSKIFCALGDAAMNLKTYSEMLSIQNTHLLLSSAKFCKFFVSFLSSGITQPLMNKSFDIFMSSDNKRSNFPNHINLSQ